MKRLKLFILLVMVCGVLPTQAQERVTPYSTVDLTNLYLWRGQRLADVSIQPVLGVKWRGLNFFVWGNTQVSPPAEENPAKLEIDIFLKYQLTKRFNIALKDVYTNKRGDGFFSYGEIGKASHGVELVLNYNWRYFVTEWTTTIFGHDGLNKRGERSYSSYLLTTVPFRVGKVNFGAIVGIVPYYTSRYDDNSGGFHVNMLSLKATYDILLSQRSGYKLPLYSQFMVNPSNEQAYLQVGCKVTLFD